MPLQLTAVLGIPTSSGPPVLSWILSEANLRHSTVGAPGPWLLWTKVAEPYTLGFSSKELQSENLGNGRVEMAPFSALDRLIALSCPPGTGT